MEPKTIDEAAAEAGSTDRETGTDEAVQKEGDSFPAARAATPAESPGAPTDGDGADRPADPAGQGGPEAHGDGEKPPSGVGQGAGAVISAALGVVSLSGSWLGTVAGARESLIGQLNTVDSAGVAKKIQEVYGDQWHAIALVGGVFALIGLIVGVGVLARPAFGVPGPPQPVWIKSVAWGGVALGVLGLLLAIMKLTDILLGLPSAS
ncbi:hypothetical protein [Streptomyces sp. NPDC050560]|uniref:hypothetical protein n=1 Tax=Streptomyces sp. NPDC050560 TaxID=3365630 RepID=UPI0037BCD8FC